VEPPGKASPENRLDLSYARNEVQGPMVDVTWYPPKCENGDCAVDETLAFSWDPAEAPERKHWSNEIAWAAQVKDRSTFVLFGPTGPTIEQRTRSGEVVWRQTALKDAGYELLGGIDLLETGELAILAVIPYPNEAPDIWRIGFDGSVKQRLFLDGLQQGAKLL